MANDLCRGLGLNEDTTKFSFVRILQGLLDGFWVPGGCCKVSFKGSARRTIRGFGCRVPGFRVLNNWYRLFVLSCPIGVCQSLEV